MFRKEEFEKILAAGIISLEENAQLIDGFILVPEPHEHRGYPLPPPPLDADALRR